MYFRFRLEVVLLTTYRKPQIRTNVCASISKNYSGLNQIRFLQLAKPYIDRDFLKARSYLYGRKQIDPLFRDDKGHHPLLDLDYFNKVSVDLASYLSPLSSSLLPAWIRWQQKVVATDSFKVSTEEPVKILFFVRSWGFIDEFIEFLKLDSRFSVECYDFRHYDNALNELHADNPKSFDAKLHHLLFTYGPHGPNKNDVWNTATKLSPELKEKTDWADIVFIDWMNFPTVWASRYFPDNIKLITRCHSHEAFTSFPLSINFSRINHVIFVASPIKNIFNKLFSRYLKPRQVSVIPNLRDLSRFLEVDTSDDARWWKVGLLKYSIATKGPLFALEVIKSLKRVDSRWKLILGGPDFIDVGVHGELKDKFFSFVDEHDLAGSIVIDGYIDDVPSWCGDIGYILSSSEREGTHEAVLEGMAAGCIPALRNWPMVKNFGGVGEVYPGWESFDDPRDLADWIVKSQGNHQDLSQLAKEFAQQRDIRIVGEEMKTVILQAVT
jgi:hypothetical protein